MESLLRIGGITIAVRCEDERIRCDWQGPIARFIAPPSSSPDFDLSVRVADEPFPTGGEVVFDSQSVWRMLRADGGWRIECRSAQFGDEPYKIAVIDDAFTRGTIFMRELSLHPLDYPLDEVLLANLLGRGRGVELHSCGVIDRDGRGHLFVGVSGAGKTTTARLWEDVASGIVSDDRVIVREHGGVVHMYGTPWHGEAELSLATSAPLAGVYLLVQSDANAIVPLSNAEAVARLFRCCFPLFHDSAALDFTLSFLEKLVDAVPVRELRFIRDPSVVDLILGQDPATSVIVDLLRRGHAVQFQARGDSMHPVIRSGDVLHVEPDRNVRVGDVVLTLAERGLTAHRVVARNADTIVTRSDNASTDDPALPLSRVLGRVRISILRRLAGSVHLAAHAHLGRVPGRVDGDG